MKHIFLLLAVVSALLPSCVSKKKFTEAEAAGLECLRSVDSLTTQLARLHVENEELENDTTALGYANRAIQKEMQELQSNTQSQLQNLHKTLAARQAEIEQREQALKDMEEMISRKDSLLKDLHTRVEKALTGFKDEDLNVVMKKGQLYVSLSENLLFKSGSAQVDGRGRDAIQRLAEVLQKNPDFKITVEGHTDSIPIKTSRFNDNWELSTTRANAIVRILLAQDINGERITAAGRGEYEPVSQNTSSEGRSLNRRTEIILSPDLEELYQLLNNNTSMK